MTPDTDLLQKSLRRLDKAIKKHNNAMPNATRILKQHIATNQHNFTSGDNSAAARAITEYVDALDFMCVMWERLKSMTLTRSWEVHSQLLSRSTGLNEDLVDSVLEGMPFSE